MDILILIVLVGFIIYGFSRGFIKDITLFSGVIFGLWLAIKKSYLLSQYLNRTIGDSLDLYGPLISKIGAFIITFFVVYFLAMILRAVLTAIINAIHLNWLDRILGGILGLFQGVVVVFGTIFLILSLFPTSRAIIMKSGLSLQILRIVNKIPHLPKKLRILEKYLALTSERKELVDNNPQSKKRTT